MIEQKGKVEQFNAEVLAEASREAQEINSELRRIRTRQLQESRGVIAQEAARYREAEISKIEANEGRRVTAARTSNKQALLRYRENCAEEVYDLVLKKIEEFTASEQYPKHIVKLFKKALSVLGNNTELKVFLREEDMADIMPLLKKEAPGAELSFHNALFEMGGIRVTDPVQGKRADLSFDSEMAYIAAHFSDLSGMHIE